MSLGASYLLNVGPDGKGAITDAYKERLLKIGDWYNRMEGCLEGAEEDDFKYDISYTDHIATKKNGNTYLHFCKEMISDVICLYNYPSKPERVRLMNTGKLLDFEIMYLPDFFRGSADNISKTCLHIGNIGIDELSDEPIVLEIKWSD